MTKTLLLNIVNAAEVGHGHVPVQENDVVKEAGLVPIPGARIEVPVVLVHAAVRDHAVETIGGVDVRPHFPLRQAATEKQVEMILVIIVTRKNKKSTIISTFIHFTLQESRPDSEAKT